MFFPLIGTETLIAIGVSLAISAVSYGIQALLAPSPPPLVGARKEDLGAPSTAAGNPIPFAVGRNIARAQIIWSTGLKETKHTEKVKGGKGGGKKQKVITYTYSTSVALAFNDGEICGIQRIIANGSKVIWSNRLGDPPSDVEAEAVVDEAEEDDSTSAENTIVSLKSADGSSRFTSQQASDASTAVGSLTREKEQANQDALQSDFSSRYSQIEVFLGTETQEPSSIIEGVEGVGNVSAFRGTAYVVIEDLELADFGNSMPIITVDYATAGDITSNTEITTTDGPQAEQLADFDQTLIDWDRGVLYAQRDDGSSGITAATLEVYSLDNLTQTGTQSLALGGMAGMAFNGLDPDSGYLVGSHLTGGSSGWSYTYDPAAGALITQKAIESASTLDSLDQILNAEGSPSVTLKHASSGAKAVVSSISTNVRAHTFGALELQTEFEGPGDSTGSTWLFGQLGPGATGDAWGIWGDDGGGAGTEYRIHRYRVSSGGTVSETHVATLGLTDIASDLTRLRISEGPRPMYDPADGSFVFWLFAKAGATDREYVVKWKEDTGVLWTTDISSHVQETFGTTRAFTKLDGSYWMYGVSNTNDFIVIDLTDGTRTDLDGTDLFAEPGASAWNDEEGCLYQWKFIDSTPDQQVLQKACFGTGCLSDPVTLEDVVNSYMDRAGYTSAERSVGSGLGAETIWGFNDNNGRSSREVLEDLARVRPVQVHESEGVIKFRLADSTSQVTIPAGDVRAYDGESEPPEWLAEVTTLEDLALPKSLQINYLDIDRALNPTSALFVREVTQASTRQEFTVQAVDTAEDMRNSVINALGVMMTQKRTFKLSLPAKYGVLEPGDRITVPVSDTRTSDVLITKVEWGANLIVELECALYIDQSLGIQHTDQFTAIDTDTATGASTSKLFLLDIPYLTDEAELNADDEEDQGLYIALGSYDEQWPGATVYVDDVTLTTETAFGQVTQATGDPDWQLVTTFAVPSVWGRLGKLPRSDVNALVKDTDSEIIVTFANAASDEFASISETTALTSQDNAFLVGNEIIQAETVELLATVGTQRVYAFTNLWRGLQGTEWAIGTQALNDNVVHLDFGGIKRFDTENIDLVGLDIDFRAVTVGEDLTGVSTVTETYDAAHLKPWAPAIENVVRDADGNLTFDLEPRNRYGAEWTPGASPSFQSDPQDFEVDIGAGSPTIRTIAVSGTTSIAYTASQQTSDGLTPGDPVTVRAFQLNANGRRGFAREETI